MIQDRLLAAAAFTPNLLESPSAWLGHLPFAGWLIQEISPKIFVELGTHSGNSYFSFCQAVLEAGLPTQCNAVDVWRGDVQAGFYGEEVFTQVDGHNAACYAGFSRLLRMTFDEAVALFADGSINLLHIDGLHTYDAVRHDFETWLPKLALGAVVIFHDTHVREKDFGVWKLWEELQERFPSNLEFVHSYGLGVLQLNNAPEDKKLGWLQPHTPEKERLSNYFTALGSRQSERFELKGLKQHVAQLDQAAFEREGQIDGLNQAVTSRDAQISVLNQAVTSRDAQINGLNQAAVETDGKIAGLERVVAERDGKITGLEQAVAERDGKIAGLEQAVVERDGKIAGLERTVAESNMRIHELNRTVVEQSVIYNRLSRKLFETRSRLGEVLASFSWRITFLLRFVHAQLMEFFLKSNHSCVPAQQKKGGCVWGLSSDLKPSVSVGRVGETVNKKFLPAFIASSQSEEGLPQNFDWKAYLAVNPDLEVGGVNTKEKAEEHFVRWGREEGRRIGDVLPPGVRLPDAINKSVLEMAQFVERKYVPLSQEHTDASRSRVKTIAFYLPQFHPIEENDKAWGKGFTEWTNVSRATPQFVGHYQPRLPGELGFYDLRLKEVQKRQIELAKQYGIYGFCYHYYWFSGKKVLEKPLEQMLADPSLDLPFCLCWANENWSRKWDGGDQEIILAQNHSVQDDMAFIKEIAPILRDPRYIRIDGKPLLMVYRPLLFPDPAATAARWRAYARDVGIGNLCLLASEAFGLQDPKQIGFDRLVQFPPHNCAKELPEPVQLINKAYNGKIFDYEISSAEAIKRLSTEKDQFPCVMMEWDNDARTPGLGHCFYDASPGKYKKWLQKAAAFVDRNKFSSEKFVFINAWNEWAEGTYLEPDQAYGYAYLQATAEVVRSHYTDPSGASNSRRSLAIVVHAFHEDIFEEILSRVKQLRQVPLKLFVTTPVGKAIITYQKLSRLGCEFFMLPVKNQGRDILPFLQIMPKVLEGGHDFLLKLHTKRTQHRKDGNIWRRELFDELLTEKSVRRAIEELSQNPKMGMLGPAGHLVPMRSYYGLNEKSVEEYSAKMGVGKSEVERLHFFAGTMFFSRVSALYPLLDLRLTGDDFEEEAGRKDGTLAHAVERLIAVSVHGAELGMGCLGERRGKAYRYASKSFQGRIVSDDFIEDDPPPTLNQAASAREEKTEEKTQRDSIWQYLPGDKYPGSNSAMTSRKILLVSHDAHPHGAQYLILNIAKILSREFRFKVELVLLGGGPLLPEFERWAVVHDMSGVAPCGSEARALVQRLVAEGHKAALVNTSASGLFLGVLAEAGLRCVALIHELGGVIKSYHLQAHVATIAERAVSIVFPAQKVAQSFQKMTGSGKERFKIKPQGLYKKNMFLGHNEVARLLLRQALGVSLKAKIVLGVGYADSRKGTDLFVEAGIKVIREHPEAYFVWVGKWGPDMEALVKHRLEGDAQADHFLFPGFQKDTDMYYAGADIFALTSREDPFPSVILESLEVSLPVVAFKEAGGFEELFAKGCGVLVSKKNAACFAEAVSGLLGDPAKAFNLGNCGARLMQEESFSFRHYIYDLLDWVGLSLKRVSAVVLSYNYGEYLPQRIRSITEQTYPVLELLVLDDASTDNSAEVIKGCLSCYGLDHKLIENLKNSGSVFRQWKKAIESSKGDLLWIAEADDVAEPRFLERLVEAFDDPSVVLAYCQSRSVDEKGVVLTENYLGYTQDISDVWKNDYVRDGREEINQALCIKNTILNVSAVLFRRSAVEKAIEIIGEDLFGYRIAGDWLVYLHVLLQGKVSFCAESLNIHRRHSASVVQAVDHARHLEEILKLQGIARTLGEPSKRVLAKACAYNDSLRDRWQIRRV